MNAQDRNSILMDRLRWMASEPFRLFFFSGALWSIVGASLWPLAYSGKLILSPSPNIVHARIMIEAFAGAFIVGFLGTAGPRLASAPPLTLMELAALFVLHQSIGFCHLAGATAWGDGMFAALLLCLLASLVVRFIRFNDESPPPAMALAMAGLLSGVAGALLFILPGTIVDPARYRLAGLLLYQGFLLAPVLGIGSFFFPRILGGDFGESQTPVENRRRWTRAINVLLLLAASFAIEVRGQVQGQGLGPAGMVLRAVTAAAYLLLEVRWRRRPDGSPSGSLATGTGIALLSGLAGFLLAARFYPIPPIRISLEHLLYAGGFGLLMLMVASRVLFGHSGELEGFAKRSWFVRFLIFLGLLAATTRASVAFLPQLTVSHHIYAAWSWVVLAALWLGWHSRRFITREPD